MALGIKDMVAHMITLQAASDVRYGIDIGLAGAEI